MLVVSKNLGGSFLLLIFKLCSRLVNTILKQIETEYQVNIDKHSHMLLLSNLELLLNYCMRFYGRQFITRTSQNKDIIAQFEQFLTTYIYSDELKCLC